MKPGRRVWIARRKGQGPSEKRPNSNRILLIIRSSRRKTERRRTRTAKVRRTRRKTTRTRRTRRTRRRRTIKIKK